MEVRTKKQPPLTYRDYLHTSDDKRFELIGGDLYMIPSPSFKHQKVVNRINFLLYQYVQKHNLGEVIISPMDVKLSEYDVLQPDIFFLSKERMKQAGKQVIEGAPDLVIEVLSESTEERDRTVKKSIYYREGVRELWLVDPEAEQLEVHTRGETGFEKNFTILDDENLKSELLDDFSPPVSKFFSEGD